MAGQWFALEADEVVNTLQTNADRGLDEREASERAARFGPNELAKAPGTPLWRMFLDQFKDFMVLVLLAATAVSGFLGEYADAVTIMIIVIVNAILGCVQEYRAERSMEALKQLTAPEARVVRNGQERKIAASELVPGDVIVLDAGDRVPADIRLLQVVDLEVEESTLTGESVPVKKKVDTIEAPHVSLGDTRNMVYLGTIVTRGRARGVVVATGMATEMGHIAGMIQDAEQEATPLQRRLAQLGKGLVAFCLLICALVVVLGIYRGEDIYDMFLAGVSLAVAAIPEGLPAIVTIALAIGVQRMIRRHAIIRKLPAVETLGCATIICSDKTGTLTQNQMTVKKALVGRTPVQITGEGYDPKGEFITSGSLKSLEHKMFLKISALCNNALLAKGEITVSGLFRGITRGKGSREWNINGDPTEGALLVMAAKGGVWREQLETKEKRVGELPFDSDRKRMTVLYRGDSGLTAYVKGAPDMVLELCTHQLVDGKRVALTQKDKKDILEYNARMAESALRVLALAYRDLPGDIVDYTEGKVERDLTFVGLSGMIDPPRPSAISAVQTCRRAGIQVAMITGDHKLTARAVAKDLGLLARGSKVISGAELDLMSDEELQKQVNEVTVYARVSPKHKLRIVRALKQAGHVVAMTGDGVNDAPAIKEADIGISMGVTGTDVTKEASAMVLADDNFTSIVAAVEEGRGIYDNIRKFIRYLLSCNVGEVLVMFLAVLGGLPLPLMPIQILWMNLVTDGLPAMALGIDPSDRDIMHRRPRDPGESIFANALAWRILGSGSVIALGTLLIFAGAYLTGQGLDMARTMAFNALVFFQLFYVFTCRSEHHTILEVGLFSNPHLILAVLISASLQMAVNYLPFLQPIFHTVPLKGFHWAIIFTVAITPPVVGTLFKHIQLRAKEKIMYLKV